MRTTGIIATSARSFRPSRRSGHSSCRRKARSFAGIRIEAIHVFETPERLPEDEVTIVHLRSEGLHLVFLGDLGHPLTETELAPLRGADVVLAAAGGPPTIDYPDIPALLDAIGPRIVIPMHFKTPKINLKIQPAGAVPRGAVRESGRSAGDQLDRGGSERRSPPRERSWFSNTRGEADIDAALTAVLRLRARAAPR